jgi:hypothetical protein
MRSRSLIAVLLLSQAVAGPCRVVRLPDTVRAPFAARLLPRPAAGIMGRVPHVDSDQLAALRRLRAACGFVLIPSPAAPTRWPLWSPPTRGVNGRGGGRR